MRLRIHITNKSALYKKLGDIADYQYILANEIRKNLYQNVLINSTTYMRFTERHGWNYHYTGQLSKSFASIIFKSRNKLTIEVYAKKNQQRIAALEYGATIHPKRREYLTVPLKHTPFPFNLINKSRLVRREKFLGRRRGKTFIPYFVLLPSVKIPEYAFMRKALRKTMKQIPKIADEIALKMLIRGK